LEVEKLVELKIGEAYSEEALNGLKLEVLGFHRKIGAYWYTAEGKVYKFKLDGKGEFKCEYMGDPKPPLPKSR
jgi:hypothetical protein